MEFLNALDRPMQDIDFSPRVILIRLGLTLVLTLLLSLVYQFLNKDKRDGHVMMHAMVYIGMILSGAMMIIGTNLVTAFGLIGAVSIIRFRTVVDNPVDMSFLFLAIVIGISSGLGLFVHAVVISVFIGVVMILLGMIHSKRKPPEPYSVRIVVNLSSDALESRSAAPLLEQLGCHASLIRCKTKNSKILLEYEALASDLQALGDLEGFDALAKIDDSVNIKIQRNYGRPLLNRSGELTSDEINQKKTD